MATKKFLLEVEEGRTECDKCLRKDCRFILELGGAIDCDKWNLATMKIKESEKEQ